MGVLNEAQNTVKAPYPLARSRRFSSRSTAALTNAVRSSPALRTASIRSKVPSENRACMSSVHCLFRPMFFSYEVLTKPSARLISHMRFESKGVSHADRDNRRQRY